MTTIDANEPTKPAKVSTTLDAFNDLGCIPALNFTEDELIKKIEYFSRNFSLELFDDAMNIYNNLTVVYPEKKLKFPLIHTYELYDKAFEFKRVRNYDLSI